MTDELRSLDAVFDQVQGWLSSPNIVGLDVGPKTVGGTVTSQRAILVFVIEKKPMAALGANDVPVPPELDVTLRKPDGTVETRRVLTDVVESGPLRLLTLNQKIRPCPGGYQIAVERSPTTLATGTLGVTTMWHNKRAAMTCAHVVAITSQLGGTVWQPDNKGDNAIGVVNGLMPITTYPDPQQKNPGYNGYDFAYSTVQDAKVTSYAIKDIYDDKGTPLGLRAPQEGEQVRFIGKSTTQVQTATIVSVSAAIGPLDFTPGQYAWFMPVLRLSGAQAVEGDSGAALVASDNKIVGLVMSATNLSVYASRIPD